jgi:hypothetical protein
VLRSFWHTYDRWFAPSKPDGLRDAVRAFRYLKKQHDAARPVVILNHPSYTSRPYTLEHLQELSRFPDVCIGIEGARGNQSRTAGSEIDPVVRKVGGMFDTLLLDGRHWSMLASSDFHSHISAEGKTYWPGEFAKTHVYCPARSCAGVLQGLRSGATYFVHNDIVGPLRFSVAAKGRRAMMGETLRVSRGMDVDVVLDCIERCAIERVEFIGSHNTPGQVRTSVRTRRERHGRWSRFTVHIPECTHDFFVRARGVAKGTCKPYRSDPGDMWFYTNPVYVEAR